MLKMRCANLTSPRPSSQTISIVGPRSTRTQRSSMSFCSFRFANITFTLGTYKPGHLRPEKKEFVLIRRFRGLYPDFKLLGVTFDPQLLMHKGVRTIAVEVGWRLSTLLRPRRYFTTPELMRLYKAHVLSFIESGVSGYFHAAASWRAFRYV